MPTAATIDNPKFNPFWPKNMTGDSVESGPTDQVRITSINFNPSNSAQVSVQVSTTPAAANWSVNWGDGTATENITGPATGANHTYANNTPGKSYVLSVTSGTDTDTRTVQY